MSKFSLWKRQIMFDVHLSHGNETQYFISGHKTQYFESVSILPFFFKHFTKIDITPERPKKTVSFFFIQVAHLIL
jgi:hypothetical protein